MESKLPLKDKQDKKEREQVLIAYLEGQLSPQEEHDLWAYLIEDASMYEEMIHLANVKEVLISGSLLVTAPATATALGVNSSSRTDLVSIVKKGTLFLSF